MFGYDSADEARAHNIAAFYADPAEGQRQVRFCFAKTRPDLVEAGRRLTSLGSGARRSG